MGGRSIPEINSPANLVSLCREDHEYTESNRAEALDMGLLLREHDDPTQVPVPLFGLGLVYLDNDGGWVMVPHAGTENP